MGFDMRPWLDALYEKHECGPSLSPYVRIGFERDGRETVVAIPDSTSDPERMVLRGIMDSDSLLVLFFWHEAEGYPEGLGLVMIARRDEEAGMYVVHVSHELYGWALGYLGLTDAEIPFRWIDPPMVEDEED
jgi:hypothetical protein